MAMTDTKFTETFASIMALKAGVKVWESYGSGPSFDVSDRTLRRLQRDTIAEKRRDLEIFQSGRLTCSDEHIALLEAQIAQIQSTF